MKQIFANLPVNDLQKTIEFFTGLGFKFNPQFTDETTTCMIIEENIFAMLMTKDRFQTFTKKSVVDAKQATEVLLAVSLESRDAVNKMADKAIELGAKPARETEEHGWMMARPIEDLDGHIWEFFYADPTQIPA